METKRAEFTPPLKSGGFSSDRLMKKKKMSLKHTVLMDN